MAEACQVRHVEWPPRFSSPITLFKGEGLRTVRGEGISGMATVENAVRVDTIRNQMGPSNTSKELVDLCEDPDVEKLSPPSPLVGLPTSATLGSRGSNARGLAFRIWVLISLGSMFSVVVRPIFLTDVRVVRKLAKRSLYAYLQMLKLHPFSARAATAAIIFFLADFAAQKLYSEKFSLARLLRYSLYGLCVMGPFLYLWYTIMHVYGPPDTLLGSIQKAIFEQITLEPLCISFYFIYDNIVLRRGMRELRRKFSVEFWFLLRKNAIFWIPANFSNYYLGTQDFRVLFANMCSFFWNVYFSSAVNGQWTKWRDVNRVTGAKSDRKS